MKLQLYWLGLLLMLISACGSKSNQASAAHATDADTVALSYEEGRQMRVVPGHAKGFEVAYRQGGCIVRIHDPQQASAQQYLFALVPRGSRLARLDNRELADTLQIREPFERIETPVRRAVCMTSLQLSNFIKLDRTDAVTGITSTRHLFDKTINARLESGDIHKIGIEGNFDNEVIMGMAPDMILISPFKRGGYDALKEVGIPLIPHLGYKEMSPLGQAEWIKFVGLLLGEEERANRLFAETERRYNELKQLTAQVAHRPIVFSGEMRGGNWYAVGGRSFLAQLFEDAGADYFLKDDQRSGGVMLDYETVYSQAASADYWRIVNSYPGLFSYDVLKEEDARYADFRAFREKGVIYCNMRLKPFYESMPVEPERVLSDLIKVFHPALLPDYAPKYYELLK